jgi:hypothetical protein
MCAFKTCSYSLYQDKCFLTLDLCSALCRCYVFKDSLVLFIVVFFVLFYSRAHTIVAISFVQNTPNEAGQSMTKTSVINLVDLAGR